MPRPKRPDPIRLGGEIRSVLSDLGHGPAADALRIAACWERAVASDVAAAAEPVGVAGDTLELRVGSSAWAHALGLRREEILSGLARELGLGAPTRLRFRVG